MALCYRKKYRKCIEPQLKLEREGKRAYEVTRIEVQQRRNTEATLLRRLHAQSRAMVQLTLGLVGKIYEPPLLFEARYVLTPLSELALCDLSLMHNNKYLGPQPW